MPRTILFVNKAVVIPGRKLVINAISANRGRFEPGNASSPFDLRFISRSDGSRDTFMLIGALGENAVVIPKRKKSSLFNIRIADTVRA